VPVVVRRRVDRVPEDPEKFWLDRLDVDTRKAARICFRRWVRWLHGKPGFENATPKDLVIRRILGDDPYEFVDLKQEFIGSLVMRKASKGKFQWAIDSFFMHNRAELPRTGASRSAETGRPLKGSSHSRTSPTPT
jgi:hypothetical protein